MADKPKKPRGRPKADPAARRSLSLPPIAVNEVERIRVEAQAQAAGVSVSEWVRYAAQRIDVPKRAVIPALNREAWLALGDDLNTLRRLKWVLESEGEQSVITALMRVEGELKKLRNKLIGARP